MWLALSMLCWASNWIVGRAFHDQVPPAALNFWRWVVCLLIALPMSWQLLRSDWRCLLAHKGYILTMSALGAVAFPTMVYVGLKSTTAVNGAVMYSSVPVFVVALAKWTLREPLRWQDSTAILASVIGVLLIATQGNLAVLRALEFNPGDLWIIAAMPVWSLYTVLLKRWPEGLSRMSFLASISAMAVLLQAPLYAAEIMTGRSMAVTVESVTAILFIGVFASFLAYVTYNSALQHVAPALAGVFHHLLPVFIALLGIAFLGERMIWYHLVGGGAIVAAICLTAKSQSQARKAPGHRPGT